MKDTKYLLAYLFPLSAWAAMEFQGAWAWATPVLAFGILPVLDAMLPASTQNLTPEEEESRSKNLFFDLLLYACAPLCYVLVFFYFRTLQTSELNLMEIVGLTFSIGIVVGSMGINVAHELGHRANKMEQALAKAGLLLVLYQHFFIEHNRGHHKYVSTDADPASARKDESIYRFFLRSIVGQYKNAWKLEKTRLQKKQLPFFSLHNEMIRFSLYQLAYLTLVALVFGIGMLPYALAIAVVAVLLLETINYIEHYGLRRKTLPSGRPERVMPRHSWNSNHELGRIFLFELTRHSDHHYIASRKYQLLRHMEESPQLPSGYPASMLMAMVPPLWFRVMNPKLEEWNYDRVINNKKLVQ
jgi:alkane 1-monooxygenase